MWLARNKTGTLTAHAHKPTHGDRNEGYDFWESYTYDNISLPISQFPEVTFENSPVEVQSFEQIAFACTVVSQNTKTVTLSLKECLELFKPSNKNI